MDVPTTSTEIEVPDAIRTTMNSMLDRIAHKKKKRALFAKQTIRIMAKTPYPLKPHQIVGLNRLVEMETKSSMKGGLLCDEPGMGKTIQMGALMKANQTDSTLIVVPVCVVNQWTIAMRNIFGKDKVIVHTGSSRPKHWEELRELRRTNGKDNLSNIIVISTYGIVVASKKKKDNLVFENEWGRVILDEGHCIRNKRTKVFSQLNKIKREHSWILSGTPLQNRLADIRTLFTFVTPAGVSLPLNCKIQYNMLRRTKKELERTSSKLDDYKITNYNCKFQSKEQQEIYMALHRNIMEDLGGEAAMSLGDVSMEMLEQILRLRQASIHPDLAIHSFCKKYETSVWAKTYTPSAKINKLIQKVKDTDGYSLVFCHFKAEMDLIQMELNKASVDSEIYCGSLNSKERAAVLSKFPTESVTKKVLIIQIKAGGVGLNLQQFTSIFIVSPDWNPSNEIQAIARAHRIGQKKKVEVFKFTTIINEEFLEEEDKQYKISTIDQMIIKKQQFKRLLMAEVLNDVSLEFNESIEN